MGTPRINDEALRISRTPSFIRLIGPVPIRIEIMRGGWGEFTAQSSRRLGEDPEFWPTASYASEPFIAYLVNLFHWDSATVVWGAPLFVTPTKELLKLFPLRCYCCCNCHCAVIPVVIHLLPNSYSHPLQLELEGRANPGGDTRTFPDRRLFLIVCSTQTGSQSSGPADELKVADPHIHSSVCHKRMLGCFQLYEIRSLLTRLTI